MAIPYLGEGSSDPLHVWFYGGIFEVGGSNGVISGFAKSKISRHLEEFKWRYLRGGSSDLLYRGTRIVTVRRRVGT